MSEREEIQNDMAKFLGSIGLNEVYGVLTGLNTADNGRKVRTVTFCRARTIDGCVIIYSPKFIQVKTRHENEVFETVEDAKTFIQLKYIDFDHEAADEVPRK